MGVVTLSSESSYHKNGKEESLGLLGRLPISRTCDFSCQTFWGRRGVYEKVLAMNQNAHEAMVEVLSGGREVNNRLPRKRLERPPFPLPPTPWNASGLAKQRR
ncbi:unnamed protein product [Victoria cruziana]